MNNRKHPQKLVSFTDNSPERDDVMQDLENGWSIINLVKNGSYYVGILEQNNNLNIDSESIYIPARKKIKISTSSAS